MKFLIKRKVSEASFIGDATLWTTGEPPYLNYGEQLRGVPVAEGKVKYYTGLLDEHIQENSLLTDEEKEIFIEKAKEIRAKVIKTFPSCQDDTNSIFWNVDRTSIKLNNENIDGIYDTDNIDNAIIYLNILGGGFPSIAPTYEISVRTGTPFYVTSEDAFTQKKYDEEFGFKRKAIAALDELLEKSGIDPLMYISYLTSGLNRGFTRHTSKETYEKILMEYIEGKLQNIDKKKAAENFYLLFKEWKTNPDAVIGRAIISAANYFGIIQIGKDRKLQYASTGLDLGINITEAYDKLMKPEYNDEFDKIRNSVNEFLNK